MTTDTLSGMFRKLNHRQKQVAINQMTGMNQTDAYLSVYKCNYETAGKQSYLLNTENPLFKAYLQDLIRRKEELALAAITETIMQPQEIKTRLSELARANLVDFLDASGRPKLSKDTPHHSAAKRYMRKTRTDRHGNPIETSEIALVDQIEALRELAKIHGMYAPEKHMVAKRIVVEMIDKRRGGSSE